MSLRLTEKYRPKTLDEVIGNKEVLRCLKSLDINNLPNMLFYGPPGTGKTTAIKALLKDVPKQNVLELNASDQRGIDTVRNIIKEFASVKMNGPKVVILDEADSMSKDAQGALRRVIEDCKNTKFCFICNYYKKIIDPIISRCSKFRFSPVNEVNRIKEVLLLEKIDHDDAGIEFLNKYSGGDMRKVMNDIQGISGSYDIINEKNALEFYGMQNDKTFEKIFESLLNDKFTDCKSLIDNYQVDCLDLIYKIALLLAKSDIKNKMAIFKNLADIEYRLAMGCSDPIQINAVISSFILNRQ